MTKLFSQTRYRMDIRKEYESKILSFIKTQNKLRSKLSLIENKNRITPLKRLSNKINNINLDIDELDEEIIEHNKYHKLKTQQYYDELIHQNDLITLKKEVNTQHKPLFNEIEKQKESMIKLRTLYHCTINLN